MRRSIAAHQLLILLVLATLSARPAQSARAAAPPPTPVVYVAPDGDDARDCASPATRCATLQRALGALAEGGEARLATGVYSGTTDIARSATIRGGYVLPNYQPSGGATVLDGQQLGTTLRIARPIWARLAGLTITGGVADAIGESDGRGGGIFIRSAKVLLDHVEVSGNIADGSGGGRGGGIYIREGSLTLASSRVTSNTASLVAASPLRADIAFPQAPRITGSGGGIYAQNARIAIQRSIVSANRAVGSDSGLPVSSGQGGGVYATGCTLDAIETVFSNNQALELNGGGALKLINSQTRLRGGEISDNQPTDRGQASSGAAIDIYSGTTTLDNLALRSNRAAGGGGILLRPAELISPTAALTLTNVLLTGHGGAALALLPNGVGTARAELRYTSVVSNGIGVLTGVGQMAQVMNSLIVENEIGTQALSGTIRLDHTNRYGNRLDADGDVLLGPGGNLALPPQFAAGDQLYRLAPDSPLIDMGAPQPGIAADFEGQSRSGDGNADGIARPDLGWDEFARSAAQFGANQTLLALPGQTIATTVELRNVGVAADIFQISISAPAGWRASVTPTVVALGPHTQVALAVTIGVPASAPLNSQGVVTLTATGQTSAASGRIVVGVGEP
jgi:hypothetical protein